MKSDHLLLPGNPEIGILNYKEQYYAFASTKAAEEFSLEPDLYVLLDAEKYVLLCSICNNSCNGLIMSV